MKLLVILLSLHTSLAMTLPKNCAVVGVGVLGTSLCQQLLEKGSQVTGITKTTNRHDSIRQEIPNLQHLTTLDECTEKFDDIVFCAPPSGSDDYPETIRSCVENLWTGKGLFVYTSSGGIYGPGENNVVTETSPTADPESSPRIARAVEAEQVVRNAGGCCLRLAGLYTLDRGPHSFWLAKGEVGSGPNGLINMLHYDDAAGACVAALLAGSSVCAGQTFLVSDGNPLTRQEICESARKHPKYNAMAMPTFDESDTTRGKIYDGSVTNKALNWQPKNESFDSFFSS